MPSLESVRRFIRKTNLPDRPCFIQFFLFVLRSYDYNVHTERLLMPIFA